MNSGRAPQPNIIKIDVEGAEDKVLEGMERILESGELRAVLCEVHRPTSEKYWEIYKKLSEFGFDIDIVTDRNIEIQIVAHRRDVE